MDSPPIPKQLDIPSQNQQQLASSTTPNPNLNTNNTIEGTTLSEIIEVHECLRLELATLCTSLRSPTLPFSLTERHRALLRFLTLRDVYRSHSRAEDDVLFPALISRGLHLQASDELETQHEKQAELFDRLGNLLAADPAVFDAQAAPEVADQLRTSILLHLRAEEEEMLPVLRRNFTKQELNGLVARVVGDRSASVMEGLLRLVRENLPIAQQRNVISEIAAVAGPKFRVWLQDRPWERDAPANARPVLVDAPPVENEARITSKDPISGALGCSHHKNGCRVFASCCQHWFPCAGCHDEAVQGSHSFFYTGDRLICCTRCGQAQRNPTTHCAKCSKPFGNCYSCTRCLVFEDNPSASLIYHCPYCDVCRRGAGLGVDLFHCMRCGTCVSNKLRDHQCVQGSLEGTCPVCAEDLATSRREVRYIPCGHLLHLDCFQEYLTKRDYRCAICRKSMVDMSVTWSKLDEVVGNTVDFGKLTRLVPPVKQVCHDCGTSSTIEWRPVGALIASGLVQLVVGEKCSRCGSFNTS